MFNEKFPRLVRTTESDEKAPKIDPQVESIDENSLQSVSYKLETGEVELKFKYVEPQEGIERISGKSVLFLSGWGDSKLNSAMSTLQAYADNAQADAYMIVPRAEGRSHPNKNEIDFLQEEADAIARFVEDHNMREVVIVGHSMGSDRALNTTSLLQKVQGLEIDGLILLAPVGLHERSPLELAKSSTEYVARFANDMKKLQSENPPFVYGMAEGGVRQDGESKEAASLRIKEEQLKTAEDTAKVVNHDAPESFKDEMMESKFGFPRRIMSEITDMARKNPYAAEISVPIVLIAGTNDPVAAHETIMPPEKEQEIRQELGEIEGQRDKVLEARERYLMDTTFPNSPAVRMLVPNKMANHLGHVFRPDTFAKTSLYMLDRIRRKEEEYLEENKKNVA